MSAARYNDLEGRLTRPKLDAVLAAVCARAGLDPAHAELVKFTNNAVFRLARAPVVVRIAGSETMRERVPKVVRVARWLADHDIPAVRLLSDVEQPIEIDGHCATLWEAVPTVGPRPTGTDLGDLLRLLHTTVNELPELPAWQPLYGIRSRLVDAEGLDRESRAWLERACDDLETGLGAVRYTLPRGIIHGDATVANLISGPNGPVMCDFDSTSIGPREWDLAPVATGHFRFARPTDNQALLAAAYGFDITTWDGFPVLRRLRELQLVTSVVPVLQSNPGLRQQWGHRFRTFQAGDTAARWELYR
jgi:Ser/Thr protein kinase RdoA (MazF antagonist)